MTLLSISSRLHEVDVPGLDVREEHLNRSHLEVVRPKVQGRDADV